MSYKTILVHVDNARHAPSRIRAAAALAIEHEAHLIGAAMTGISRFLPPQSIEMGGPALAEHVELMQQDAKTALRKFDAIVNETGVPSAEQRCINDDFDGGLALQARYVDLVVLSQFDGSDPATGGWSDLPEYVFLNAARPVLVLPHNADARMPARRAVVAWDGSVEATRAITLALPMLKKADLVSVVVFNAGAPDADHATYPGEDIGLYLSRHGAKVEVARPLPASDIGEALLQHVEGMNADLLVMGGYGHTRFREMLLGGITRTILNTMTVPVLMAH